MHYVSRFSHAVVLLCLLGLSACGGGGSDDADSVPTTTVSTHALTFSAASPDAPAPAAQTFTATVSPGTVYFSAVPSGPAISSATYVMNGNTATVTVTPAAPVVLGAGSFTAIISVSGQSCADSACNRLVSGERQDIAVTFKIPPVVRFVGPYVATSNTTGNVLIRGLGFQKFTVSGVSFGATAASAFTVNSDTVIQATFPALAAGSYPVQIQAPTSPGAISTSANLVVVDPQTYTAGTLAYPTAAPAVKQLLYDAQRKALLLATDSGGGGILRYAYNGSAWGTPTAATVSALQDIALSTDGTQLLGLQQTAVTQVDPTSLALGTATSEATLASGVFFKNLAVTNDGNAIVTTGFNGSSVSLVYLYTIRTPGFYLPVSGITLDNASVGASGDGSLVELMQGDSTLTVAPLGYQFLAATNAFATTVSLNQNSIAPALDRAATRVVLNGANVYDTSYALLGTLPTTTLAVVVKPDATRVYTYDSAAAAILAFDVTTAAASAGAFTQLSATPLAGDPGSGVKMAITPDGSTLFIAGSNQIVIQPAP